MAYPALTDLTTFIVVISVGMPATYLVSKALKLHPPILTFPKKKKQALLSDAVFAAAFLGTFGIYAFYDKIWVRTTLTADPVYVLRASIAILILLLPMIVVLLVSRQRLVDIALTQENLGRNLGFGALVSFALVLVLGILSPFLGGGFAGFSTATIFLFLSYVVIAFGEELVFRGYLQTRLVAKNGTIIGLCMATLFYALYNVPLGFFCYGGDIWLALVYGAWRLSSGLIYGYTFHRSQNIVPSVIVHIFLVWGGLLFSLYL